MNSLRLKLGDKFQPQDAFFALQTCYVWVSDQSNIAMFWVKKLISQSTVPAESPFLEEMIFTH